MNRAEETPQDPARPGRWRRAVVPGCVAASALAGATLRARVAAGHFDPVYLPAVFLEHLEGELLAWGALLTASQLAVLAIPRLVTSRRATSLGRLAVVLLALGLVGFYAVDAHTEAALRIHFDHRLLWHTPDLPYVTSLIADEVSFSPVELVLASGVAVGACALAWRTLRGPSAEEPPVERAEALAAARAEARSWLTLLPVLAATYGALAATASVVAYPTEERPLFEGFTDSFVRIQLRSLAAGGGFEGPPTAARVARVRQAYPGARWVDDARPLLRDPDPAPLEGDGRYAGWNVIVVILESFRAADVGSLGGTPGVTPEFDRLAADGVLFERAYCVGTQTARAYLAIECSLLPLFGERLTRRADLPRFLSLGHLLEEAGYRTTFFNGASGEFDRQREFFVAQGTDEVICLEELQDDATLPRFTWGIHDAGLYRRALEHLATQPQPFGATIMTLSSHQPYAFGAFPPGAEGREADYRGALHYADGALGAFYDALREQPWWPRTLLVVTADNGTSFSGETETVRVSASEEATRIPLLLIAGDGSLTPRRTDRIASQVDILPTLARLLGLQRRNAWWGRSLLDERGPRRAFHSSPWGAGMITSWEGSSRTTYVVEDRAFVHSTVSGFALTPRDPDPEAERVLEAAHCVGQYVLRSERFAAPER